jgi:hypothetical protein
MLGKHTRSPVPLYCSCLDIVSGAMEWALYALPSQRLPYHLALQGQVEVRALVFDCIDLTCTQKMLLWLSKYTFSG